MMINISVLVQYNGGFLPDIILLTQLCTTVFMFCYDWWLCMINISVQYNGRFLPDIILLTQGYCHWGTRLNTM